MSDKLTYRMRATFTVTYDASPEHYGERDTTPAEMAMIDQAADPGELFLILMPLHVVELKVEPVTE